MSSVPFTYVEFFFVLSLWIPNTLENEPFWCGNWCRRSHWFYCCIKPTETDGHVESHIGSHGTFAIFSYCFFIFPFSVSVLLVLYIYIYFFEFCVLTFTVF
jgi:hypothetical protein